MINNNMPDSFQYIWTLIVLFKDILLGLISGCIAYIFKLQKAEQDGGPAVLFKISSLVINMTLGAYAGYIVGTLLPDTIAGRDALIALSGLGSYNIILLAESKLAILIFEKLINTKLK